MWTELHWVDGPWQGKLALAARPRGGDWLADEIANWRAEGVDAVLSLLTPDEEFDLGLESESMEVQAQDLEFLSLPICDREVPSSESQITQSLNALDWKLSHGKNVVVHCRQGIGRTGLIAACLLISKGLDPAVAVEKLSTSRGEIVPETPEQRKWIDRFAASLAATQ